MKAYKVRPASDELPYKVETGTQNHEGIYVWKGHNYTLAIVERLGLLDAGGRIRVGPVHYNTLDETEKFGDVLRKVA